MVSIVLQGRLGNQLFEVAACYAHALSQGTCDIHVHGQLHPYLQHIRSKDARYGLVWHEPHYHYSPIPAEATHLIGYYQSSKYFSQYASHVRRLLEPRSELIRTINEKYASILTPHMRASAIVVHVRRGDYQSPQLVTKYGFLGCDYFQNAIRRMRELNPGGLMLVFSDDINWCKEQHIFKDASFIDEGDDSLALTLMSQYKHYILSNSSFSWWAAWLAGEDAVVLAPERWYDSSFIADYQDVYEDNWEKIPVEC